MTPDTINSLKIMIYNTKHANHTQIHFSKQIIFENVQRLENKSKQIETILIIYQISICYILYIFYIYLSLSLSLYIYI